MSTNNIRKNEIKRWWDSPRNLRWDKFYETNDLNSYMISKRLGKTLEILDSIADKNKDILELGCGAGQSSEKILLMGHKYVGIDISEQLISCAKERCKNYIESKKAKFFVQTVDESLPIKSNSQDIVLIIGMLQYVDNLDFCFNEIKRILKKDGHILICQTNMYHVHDFFLPRSLLVKLSYLFLNEEYEISNSIKSVLLETKLNKLFKFNKNSSIMKSGFMTKGYIKRQYNFRKRLMSLTKLSKLLKIYKFSVVETTGVPFFYTDNKFFKPLFSLLDCIALIFLKVAILSSIKHLANNVIILGKNESA